MKVFFFGDSICYGQGISLHKGWIPKISSAFEENNLDVLVANSAVNGRTTRQALETMPFEIQNYKPEILIVQFGMNDCNYWVSDRGLPRVSKKSFQGNLEEIIERGFNFGCKKIFLNTNHPTLKNEKLPFNNVSFSYQESNEQYNELIRESALSFSKNVILNDIEKVFLKKCKDKEYKLSNLLLTDKLHLSEKGHEVYFNTIFLKIFNELKKIK
ncbi:MAG: hypothetical protein CMF98_06230 [Candidatus Marinimicrobia bacterium]|nr:hypothetical protein [Candidatus Neomarinimicrobiota bacterium]RPG13258.1 MAG: SGNH/GDSL hydrolase family protein [Pelagibacteraceae bacterium TMED232]